MLLSFCSSLKGLHSCLRLGYRYMTLLFAHNPSSHLPTQPLLVTIFTLHRTFPHSCLYLPPVVGRSLYTVISSYLSITTYCLLGCSNAQYSAAMHSLLTHAQSAYLCTARTARLPTRSLLVQYIRTL